MKIICIVIKTKKQNSDKKNLALPKGILPESERGRRTGNRNQPADSTFRADNC